MDPLPEPEAWNAALRLLARRERTRAELAAALSRRGFTEATIAAVTARAEALGFLNEARAARQTVAARLPGHGDAALKYRLRQRGIPEPVGEAALSELTAEAGDELTRARALWQRKFGAAPTDAKTYAKQARFLAARGFAWETIRRVLKDPPDDTERWPEPATDDA